MNEPAFPVFNHEIADYGNYPGMTLRDYFAAKAMHALMTEPQFGDDAMAMITNIMGSPSTPKELPNTFAKCAYMFADAMLKARNN